MVLVLSSEFTLSTFLQSEFEQLVQDKILSSEEADDLSESNVDFDSLLNSYNDAEIIGSETVLYSVDTDTNRVEQIFSTQSQPNDSLLSQPISAFNSNLFYRVDFLYFVADIAINQPKFVSGGNGSTRIKPSA
ncbi:hypothetical protein [Paenibacillus sp. GCM10012306]|uniref:hypothetical protein n=1 Tax=Paenibacillus sp. GCM10012306 TaxID=3317342 RepID=UPI00360CD210